MPLAVDAQMIATPEGLFTLTRVPQGVLNSTTYFQGVMTEVLAGLNSMIWVDEIVWWETDERKLLNTLDKILGRLEDTGLFAAAQKCMFFDIEIAWRGKVYSRGQVSHDLERLSGLASMRRPQTAGELMLEEHMGQIQRRTK